MDDHKLSENMEMYLKTIYQLVEEKGTAKATDIAGIMDVKLASVTNALRKLSRLGLITYEPYSSVFLTDKGKERAEDVLNNYEILFDFLVKVLDVDEELADAEACTMEHHISPLVLQKFVGFMKTYKK
jgi:DtxR family Mn-dependent transcriptional regulator